MPIHEFICADGHITERLFRSFDAAEGVEEVACTECSRPAQRIASTPYPAHLLGNPDGYHKPSATKRYNTKTVSQRHGNKFSAS